MAIISVIIPCYNQGHYLPFALDSILGQTFAQWEAIVVDDGSTDETASIAKKITDPRIRYIYQANAGLSAARNTGIRAAQGQFLAFLDADDEWTDEFLAASHAVLANDDTIAGVYTRCRYIDPQGKELPAVGGQVIAPAKFRQRLLQGGFFPPNAGLIRASILEKSGLFDTKLTSVEDWDLWLRISEWQSMRAISSPLARYRVYPGSMSTNTARMHDNRVAVLNKQFPETGDDFLNWLAPKRMAFGYAYLATALGYLGQHHHDCAWHWIEKAFLVWPSLLEEVDPFYELVCKDQPRGYRGLAAGLDITSNAAEMFKKLNEIWDNAPETIMARRSAALGNAHLAVAMLFDQAGDWPQARKHLISAIRANRKLLRDAQVRRRLAKVTLMRPRLVTAIQRRGRATND